LYGVQWNITNGTGSLPDASSWDFSCFNLLMSIKFPQADQLILPVVMLMTGLSFITLLSLQDPLRESVSG
jgi:hypothetical protein